ncbi:hypothetical protein [Salinisphaera dokdonensis]|uniref:hypothetical protein n=1 Tax=Salinisphaera dokdonensis TaxID=454598 RepID=UPI00333EF8B0
MKSCHSEESTSSSDSRHLARRWLEPRSILVGGLAAAALGLLFNWNWVVAVGIAPLLFTLPCMIMMGWMMWSMRPKPTDDATARQEPNKRNRYLEQTTPSSAPSAQSKED